LWWWLGRKSGLGQAPGLIAARVFGFVGTSLNTPMGASRGINKRTDAFKITNGGLFGEWFGDNVFKLQRSDYWIQWGR
jgi:hypothetical protein